MESIECDYSSLDCNVEEMLDKREEDDKREKLQHAFCWGGLYDEESIQDLCASDRYKDEDCNKVLEY